MAAKWTPSMSTGVAELDKQHQELIDRLNDLTRAMIDGHGTEKLGETLDFLGTYAVNHFAAEEAQMARHRCPMEAANKKAHADFVKRFGEIQHTVAANGATATVLIATMRELSTWLVSNIQGCDAKLKSCVQA